LFLPFDTALILDFSVALSISRDTPIPPSKPRRLPPKPDSDFVSFQMDTTSATASMTQCVGKQLGDGCNGDFPRKDFEGLCARCLMLGSVENDPREYQRRQVSSIIFPISQFSFSICRNTRSAWIAEPLHDSSRENNAEDVDN
jgi:hypothetical protein